MSGFRAQERVLNPIDLELQDVVSHLTRMIELNLMSSKSMGYC